MNTRNDPGKGRFEIQRLSAGHANQVSELISEVILPLEYYSEEARTKEIAKYSAPQLQEQLNADPDSVLVALDQDRPVAFCLSRPDDGLIWLSWFGVSQDHRKSGLGQAMLDALAKTMPARSAHKIWCDTRTTNLVSQKVLQAAGYRKIATLTNHWYGKDFFLWER